MSQPILYDQVIVDKVKLILEAIVTGTDYYITPKKVFDANPTPFAVDEELPAYNIQEADETILEEDASLTVQDISMPLFIDIITNDAAIARKMKADAVKAIRQDLTLGLATYNNRGFVLTTKFMGFQTNVISQAGQGDLIANKRIQIEVQYRRPVN